MNREQKMVLVYGLYGLAAALILVFWRFGYGTEYRNSLLIWSIRDDPFLLDYGLRLRMGIIGIFLGLIAPIALAISATMILKSENSANKN